MQSNPIEIVQTWQDAVNRRDIDTLIAVSDPRIELIGPRGSGFGHQLLRDWLERAGFQMETLQVFARGDMVVVAQHGIWRSPETGAIIGEQVVASRFRVSNGRVVQFGRYDHVDEALAAAGLQPTDEVSQS